MTDTMTTERPSLDADRVVDPGLFSLEDVEIALWRAGGTAVVSLSIRGHWLRILEADMGNMFFESIEGPTLRAAWRKNHMARRLFKRFNAKRPALDAIAGADR